MNRQTAYYISINAAADPERQDYEDGPAAEKLYDILEESFDLLSYREEDDENITAASFYYGYIDELSDLQDLNEAAQILGRDLKLEVYDEKKTTLLMRVCYRADGIVVIDTENL